MELVLVYNDKFNSCQIQIKLSRKYQENKKDKNQFQGIKYLFFAEPDGLFYEAIVYLFELNIHGSLHLKENRFVFRKISNVKYHHEKPFVSIETII